jgi:hypothetical protein
VQARDQLDPAVREPLVLKHEHPRAASVRTRNHV